LIFWCFGAERRRGRVQTPWGVRLRKGLLEGAAKLREEFGYGGGFWKGRPNSLGSSATEGAFGRGGQTPWGVRLRKGRRGGVDGVRADFFLGARSAVFSARCRTASATVRSHARECVSRVREARWVPRSGLSRAREERSQAQERGGWIQGRGRTREKRFLMRARHGGVRRRCCEVAGGRIRRNKSSSGMACMLCKLTRWRNYQSCYIDWHSAKHKPHNANHGFAGLRNRFPTIAGLQGRREWAPAARRSGDLPGRCRWTAPAARTAQYFKVDMLRMARVGSRPRL